MNAKATMIILPRYANTLLPEKRGVFAVRTPMVDPERTPSQALSRLQKSLLGPTAHAAYYARTNGGEPC